MKNAINYYYNLEVSDIHQVNGNYKFQIGGNRYLLVFLNHPYNLDTLYKLSTSIYKMGIYNHQFIPNKENNLVTMVNNKPYLLLWYYQEMDQLVTLKDILAFSNQNFSYLENQNMDWGLLWANKIDYFEYQMSEFKQKYPLIRGSINYFIGIAETGISLFNSSKREYDKVVITHNRIRPNDTLFDLYNPLNFVVDLKVRDVAEYFKANFLEDSQIIDKIKIYIENENLDSYELLMFYIRFFYPSFYFDIYEKIVNENLEEKEIQKAIDQASQYEKFLKDLYRLISRYIILPDIEWIKKT